MDGSLRVNWTHKHNLRVILNDYEKDLSLFGMYAKLPEKLKFLNIFRIFFSYVLNEWTQNSFP